ncbi:MAG: hypothetical protein A4E53_03511 [Pelotomaculum sp. PtaB.Bin104]|nr:MAG: hypothetical protein A4E53_03511 [Pelotomaculum sp. PtaB.Bin104]
MHNTLAKLAEAKIREAINNGELKNLPGAGKPVEIDNMLFVPYEDRLAYMVMKNAGLVPNEVALKKEIACLQKSLADCQDPSNKDVLKKRLRDYNIQYHIIMEKKARR